MLSISQKVEKLNKKVDGTLSITYYFKSWSLHSYGVETMFLHFWINKKTFNKVVDEAYKAAFSEKEIEV